MVEAFLLSLAPTRNGMYRTGLFTSSAADTLRAVRVFHRVDFHLTGFCTFSTADTFRTVWIFINLDTHITFLCAKSAFRTFGSINLVMVE